MYTKQDFIEDVRKIAVSRLKSPDDIARGAAVPIYFLKGYHQGSMADGPHNKIPDKDLGGVSFFSYGPNPYIEVYDIPNQQNPLSLARAVIHELGHVIADRHTDQMEVMFFGTHGPRWIEQCRELGIYIPDKKMIDWCNGAEPCYWDPDVFAKVSALPLIQE